MAAYIIAIVDSVYVAVLLLLYIIIILYIYSIYTYIVYMPIGQTTLLMNYIMPSCGCYIYMLSLIPPTLEGGWCGESKT